MHRPKSAAQPRNKSSKNSLGEFYPSRISYCPKCGEWKAPRNKLCNKCRIASRKPPIIEHVFIVEGERCRKIPLTRGQYAIVDARKYKFLMQWCWYAAWSNFTNTFYAFTAVRQKDGRQHFVSMQEIVLKSRSGKIGDHINHDTLDNRLSNLRPCTPSQNQMHSIRRKSASGYRGVKINGRGWSATVRVNKRDKHLGTFSTPKKAAKAFDIAARKYYGEFAVLNFPKR